MELITAKAESRYQIGLQCAALTRCRANTAALKKTQAAPDIAVASTTPSLINESTATVIDAPTMGPQPLMHSGFTVYPVDVIVRQLRAIRRNRRSSSYVDA